jgi:hypothetical protein
MTPGNPAPVIEVAGHYCDVLSFNMYEKDVERMKEELTRLHKLSNKPVMLTEYAFLAKDSRTGNTNKGYEQVVVQNDKERGEHYARCMEALSKLPFVVGLHWFQYHDQPSQGRADGENCSFGFVDVEDRVYDDLAKAASEANRRALKVRRKLHGSMESRPFSGNGQSCLRKNHARCSSTPSAPWMYGPDDKTTTKTAAGVILHDGAEPIMKRWVTTDVTTNPKVQLELKDSFLQYGVTSVAMSQGNMGCPHEECEDFPHGEDCSFCSFWKGKQGSRAREV